MSARNTFANVNDAFIYLAKQIYESPDFEVSPRGQKTKESLNISVAIANPYERCVTNPHRRFSLRYAVGEWLWYRRASNSLNEIVKYSSFWEKISDDGKTVNSGYGFRIFGKHPAVGVDQWQYVKDELSRDPNSRRAIIIIAVPQDTQRPTKDLVCTMFLQFFIRDSRLHMVTNMRSNDLVLGFANDIFAFTLFQEQLLVELRGTYSDLEMGYYYHNANSLHIYERNFEMIEEVLNDPEAGSVFTLPQMLNLSQIDLLQKNEVRIRHGAGEETLHPLTDPFCRTSQDALLKKITI